MTALSPAELSLTSTHRLIPSKYSEGGTVLSRLSAEAAVLEDLVELDGATNDRLLGEAGRLPGIGVYELVYGVPYAHIVNAAFTHASPGGGRFNSGERGAWYAGLDRETSLAEVAFHKLRQLDEVAWEPEEISTCDDYLADFTCAFHDLRPGPAAPDPASTAAIAGCLEPGPIPTCYLPGQQLARELLNAGANGVVYPSVRRRGGECIACFRPALVYNVRRDARLELRLQRGRAFRARDVRKLRLPAA